jgi:hypothetical protein
MADMLKKKFDRDVHIIDLADYDSMNDKITISDLSIKMQDAWAAIGLSTAPRSVDAITHSTGGLVIRDWITRYFKAGEAPIKNLVMLAPPNFGSPLAPKGNSFIGRIVKGFVSSNPGDFFQVGEEILKNLELASPYTWDLAFKDRFDPNNVYYGAGKILCTVLVGNTGFTGISAAANEEGSDGAARVSAANLKCAFVDADFSIDPKNPVYKYQPSCGSTAFGILDNVNHGSIILKDPNIPNRDQIFDKIVAGLTIDDAGFGDWINKLENDNKTILGKYSAGSDSYKHSFQNVTFLVMDDMGNKIADYFIEFYVEDDDKNVIAELFHGNAIRNVHAYGDNPAYRCLLIDYSLLEKEIDKIWEGLKISLTVTPEFVKNRMVGYRTFADDDIGGIEIKKDEIYNLFKGNQTVLFQIKLKRERSSDIFKLKQLP